MEPPPAVVMFHGTSLRNADLIRERGFRPSIAGCLGPGVYCGPVEQALKFATVSHDQEWPIRRRGEAAGAVIKVQFAPTNPMHVQGDYKTWQSEGHDACCASQTSCSSSLEWCIGDPAIIEIVGIEPVDLDPTTLRQQYLVDFVRREKRRVQNEAAATQALAVLRSARQRQQRPPRADDAPPVEVPDWIICPITYGVMVDPVILDDGHTYERGAVTRWLRDNDTSPSTGVTLSSTALIPNLAVRSAAHDFLEQHPEHAPEGLDV
eukprot:1931618-Prymnesium_polylepis.1